MQKIKLKEILRNLMKEKGYTYKSLSDELKIPSTTLKQWASGTNPSDMFSLRKLCRHFNVPMEYMIFGEVSDKASLEELLTEDVFDGFLKVKIERVIVPSKKKKK